MIKRNVFLIGFFLIVFLILLTSVFLFFYFSKFDFDDYYAVYLKTGDIYFGKLSRFPYLSLSNVWYLRTNSQGEVSISRFDQSVWGPEDKIKINKDQVVWIAKISPTSQIFSLVSGKSSNLSNPNVNISNPNSSSYPENFSNNSSLDSSSSVNQNTTTNP
ncbi:MAG: hypothetical protein KatS3mg098_488 [Candidatus Parcubacteria bacterium]|nr:MAG: hypothetical protein KatS3mg098_488 [Candidatus Parcubacteria bacterium]